MLNIHFMTYFVADMRFVCFRIEYNLWVRCPYCRVTFSTCTYYVYMYIYADLSSGHIYIFTVAIPMILGARHGLSIIDVYCRSLKTSSVIINIISYQPYVVQLLFFLGHFPMWFSTMWHSQVARRCLQLAASTQSARATRRIECQLSGGTVVLFFLNAGETKIPPTGFGITLQFWDQFLRAFQIFGWICNQIVCWMEYQEKTAQKARDVGRRLKYTKKHM